MPVCIGRPIIEALAREGAWTSESGESVVAASDLFGSNPYAEAERLRAALRDAVHALDGIIEGDFAPRGSTAGNALFEAKQALRQERSNEA